MESICKACRLCTPGDWVKSFCWKLVGKRFAIIGSIVSRRQGEVALLETLLIGIDKWLLLVSRRQGEVVLLETYIDELLESVHVPSPGDRVKSLCWKLWNS